MDLNYREAQHLCVLVHGLLGSPSHLEVMSRCLRLKHPQESLQILVAKTNRGDLTCDGIELGGERVCREIEEEIENLAEAGKEIKRFSIVGYSLGGLVARYVIGLLYSKGFFDRIEPVNFTNFASPHLGVRTPLKGWHNHLWNVLLARILSASGRQLFGTDEFQDSGKPLLELLGDPESIFIKGLAQFKRRSLYANIVKDRNAVFYTTWISKTDPFVPLDKKIITYSKGYEEVILDLVTLVVPRKLDALDPTCYRSFSKGFNTLCDRLPVLLDLMIVIPLSSVAFFILSRYWSLRSSRRIRLYKRGLASIQPSDYRVPLLIKGVPEVTVNVDENLQSSQDTGYIAPESNTDTETNVPSSAHGNPSHQVGGQGSVPDHEESQKSHPSKRAFPILALAPYQFRVIDTLDRLDWHKYPVHIQQLVNSDAAIIVRIQKPRYSERYDVFRHWLDKEFIVDAVMSGWW